MWTWHTARWTNNHEMIFGKRNHYVGVKRGPFTPEEVEVFAFLVESPVTFPRAGAQGRRGVTCPRAPACLLFHSSRHTPTHSLVFIGHKTRTGTFFCSLHHCSISSDQHGEEQGFQHAPKMLERTSQWGCSVDTAKLMEPSAESQHELHRVCCHLEVSSCKSSAHAQPVAGAVRSPDTWPVQCPPGSRNRLGAPNPTLSDSRPSAGSWTITRRGLTVTASCPF